MDVDQSNSLKRCSSAPQINIEAAVNQIANNPVVVNGQLPPEETTNSDGNVGNSVKEPATVPSSFANIFAPRARRFSTSFNPQSASPSSKLVPRISQIRQEELEVPTGAREVIHEREIHREMQMSQSYEDLTLITEGWSFKGDGQDTNSSVTNLLHLNLTNTNVCCSSPSPTRNGMRLPYGLSPSPTRKSFATRRSMSPIAMRPSQLASSVKRKFELDDPASTYSPPPFKKLIIDRNPSPSFRQTPSPLLCPSPDSCASSYEGRTTPKFFVSKLFSTSNNNNNNAASSGTTTNTSATPISLSERNSIASSPATTEPTSEIDSTPPPSDIIMDCGTDNTTLTKHSDITEDNGMNVEIIFKEPELEKCDSIDSSLNNKKVLVPCDNNTTQTSLASDNNNQHQEDDGKTKDMEKMTVDDQNSI